jgi:predicted  nucleic acid-binding Zn-ribbon protein
VAEEDATAGSGSGARPQGPFEVLLAVQDLDTHIAQLQHRKAALPERAALNEMEGQLRELAGQIATAVAQQSALVTRQNELETQIEAVNNRRKALEERLYGARGTAARDLQAMNEEIDHLGQRRGELEETELALIEEQEPVDQLLESLGARKDPLDEQAAALRVQVAEAEAEVNAELALAETSRATEAAHLPADLAQRYEVLRVRLKGTGAARLIGSHCDGCHLELSAVEVDRIKKLGPDQVITCDQCGRILVRASSPRS